MAAVDNSRTLVLVGMMNQRLLLTIGGILLAGMMTICAICGGLVYVGAREFEKQVETAIERNVVVQKHIGTDVEVAEDEDQTMELSGLTEFCYDVTGPLGEGTVYADFVTVDADTEEIGYGILKLPGGESYDLNTGKEIDGTNINVAMSVLRNQAIAVSED